MYTLYKDILVGESKNQNLDVLIPKTNLKKIPFVVIIHGGAWMGSKKEDYHYFAEQIAAFGYAVVNVNYRLIPDGASCYDMLNDIDNAIKYIIKNSDTYNLDTSKTVLAGCSAGAHLALLYTYKKMCPIPVKLVFNMVGPCDFSDKNFLAISDKEELEKHIYMFSKLSNLEPRKFINGEIPIEALDISPVHFIDKDVPLTISAYGKHDTVVPFTNAISIHNKIQSIDKNKSILVVYENSNHFLKNDPEKDIELMEIFQRELSKIYK